MSTINATTLFYTPLRSGYLPGEKVKAALHGIQGEALGDFAFKILDSPGSGFAGQVYRAVLLEPGAVPGFPARVAIKVLRPRSGWKNAAREALFWISFQAPFAPRLREEAVISGLLWQSLLRAAAEEELGPLAVACPLGYFWDTQLGSFAEVHEWVEGRPVRYETDEWLVARWLGRTPRPPDTEMARKKRFMDALAGLCRKIGAVGLARQYAWFTLVSQDNVLSRAGGEADSSHFAAVDCRNGLAFPFFLPFTPVHLQICLEGLRRGRLAHYDEVDFRRLDAYLASHPALAADCAPRVERLKKMDARYRSRLPDLWHTRAQMLFDRRFRLRIRAATEGDWARLNLVDARTWSFRSRGALVFAGLCLLRCLPLLGDPLLRWTAHPGYRAHVRAIFASASYRQTWLETARARDLAEWGAEKRIPAARAARLARSTAAYLLEKVSFGWLPPGVHRLVADPDALRRLVREGFIRPLRLLISQGERVAWLEGIVAAECERGLIEAPRAAALMCQVHEPHMQGFIRDLGLTAGLDVCSRLVYLALGIYGISTGDFWPLGVAALGPVPPSGPLRLLYVLVESLRDLALLALRRAPPRPGHLLAARLSALLASPWRVIGNLFPLLEISAYYPRLALLLADHYVAGILRGVPVFGGRGKLLEYWAFQLCYNLPVGVKKLLVGED